MWRDWFTFSRQDRRAILLLAVLIVIALTLLWTKPIWYHRKPYEAYSSDSLLQSISELVQDETVALFAPHRFDPNTADSLELLSVGLSPYVARNILRYRKAGGFFREPDDLARIYGLHDTVFARIKPYIAIPLSLEEQQAVVVSDTMRRKHPYASYMQAKYKPGKFVELNTADTTELMKIPGIGPVRAQKIVAYRRSLGGFHYISQVHEAYDLPEHLGDWVHISVPKVEKLYINKSSLSQLQAHPYLNFYQARAIVELRKREGDIRSIRQLLFLNEFTKADLVRLEPYLSFE